MKDLRKNRALKKKELKEQKKRRSLRNLSDEQKFRGYLLRNQRVLSILTKSEVKIFERRLKLIAKTSSDCIQRKTAAEFLKKYRKYA